MNDTKTALAPRPEWVDLSSSDPAASRDWYATEARVARASCGSPVPRVRPTMAPRAYGSQ